MLNKTNATIHFITGILFVFLSLFIWKKQGDFSWFYPLLLFYGFSQFVMSFVYLRRLKKNKQEYVIKEGKPYRKNWITKTYSKFKK